MKITRLQISPRENHYYLGKVLVGATHKIDSFYIPEVFIKPGHVRFCEWMNTLKGAEGLILCMLKAAV